MTTAAIRSLRAKIVIVGNSKWVKKNVIFVLNYLTVLVYTKTVDSVFRALLLATQSVNIPHYSLIHLQFLRASDAKLA